MDNPAAQIKAIREDVDKANRVAEGAAGAAVTAKCAADAAKKTVTDMEKHALAEARTRKERDAKRDEEIRQMSVALNTVQERLATLCDLVQKQLKRAGRGQLLSVLLVWAGVSVSVLLLIDLVMRLAGSTGGA